ncbi:MAG: hypothetical protein IPK91_11480 [Saprospiraceae bacterium]|jgi:HPt (histidine-containing phosphotransfer) domain-containing protein|nr:hypothetical protein [Saprospiraceae bacterium]MBK8297875.1 hypothetical protein [Saprospiraceae bacterium]
MEILIDLKLIREIVFRDDQLLKEMLDEWIQDSDLKMNAILEMVKANHTERLFNKIHELKTNFSMIHCPQGIQSCEQIIGFIERQDALDTLELNQLKLILSNVKKQLLNQIEHIK